MVSSLRKGKQKNSNERRTIDSSLDSVTPQLNIWAEEVMHLVMRPLCPHLQIRRVLERTCVTTSHPTHEAEGSLSMSRQRLMVPGTTFISLRDEETKSRPEASRPGAAPNTMRPIPVQKDSLNVTSRVLFELLGIFSRRKIQAHTKASSPKSPEMWFI